MSRTPGVIAAALLSLLSACASPSLQKPVVSAFDSLPHLAQADISLDQWTTYRNAVLALPDTHVIELDVETVVYSDTDKTLTWHFTNGGHPAHPAAVVMFFEKDGPRMSIGSAGYFAGSKAAYESWYDIYLQRNRRLIEAIEGLNYWSAPMSDPKDRK